MSQAPSLAPHSSRGPLAGEGSVDQRPVEDGAVAGGTYSTASGLVVAALASDLEGDIVGRVALDLDGAGREVVEVLVQQLRRGNVSRGASIEA